ncbi:MAG: hypothetical protein AVDCRST_MAG38-2163 [uncultured Solirubrobacteraceae bacterium]|uniref:Uncharacterized protein n=1 Tax=uncultured Solirubrobacteraceae bacterium TaxID=1162706 RepID=A0A6J4RVX9_9ACTN|nr:MAG: hypothetical protein AVDCRST_MAG38-2163 [uncultured Solirubrobacteraceae bacterium]
MPAQPSHPHQPSREMIHEALRGWPALHAYELPDEPPAPRASTVAQSASRR